MTVLFFLFAIFSSSDISSLDACPPVDSLPVLNSAWGKDDLEAYSRLTYFYTVCDTGEGAKQKLNELMLKRYSLGANDVGVTLLSGKFSNAIGGVCKETYAMRKSLLKKRDVLKPVSAGLLGEMDSLCHSWGAR